VPKINNGAKKPRIRNTGKNLRIMSIPLFRQLSRAEWLGNDNLKTMIKVKTIGQMLPFEKRHDLPSPSPALGYELFSCPLLNQIFFLPFQD
jgi:hypothetical protein